VLVWKVDVRVESQALKRSQWGGFWLTRQFISCQDKPVQTVVCLNLVESKGRNLVISKILVATDGSEVALKASRYAIQLAKQLKGSITILSVIDNRSFPASYAVPPETTRIHLTEPIEDFLKEVARRDIARVKKLCESKGVSCRTVISSGHPVEEIVREAERLRCNLIVLGSHGKRALAAAFLGSVAYGVIHKETHIPVLIVRRKEQK
jgi:nucleotide-binding universal stress UspA family protein